MPGGAVELKVVYAMLAEIAALEERLEAAGDARERHTRRDDHLGALGRELAADSEAARRAVEQAQAALRRLDRELAGVEADLASHRQRLAAVADVRQAAAVRQEAESLARRRADLEAEALGLLETLEAAEAAVSEAEADAGHQAGRSQRELGALAAAAARGAEAAIAGQAELERLLALLPPELGRHLRRLRGRGGRGVAIVRGAACGGCFGQLPAALLADVERRRLVGRCPGCGRVVIVT